MDGPLMAVALVEPSIRFHLDRDAGYTQAERIDRSEQASEDLQYNKRGLVTRVTSGEAGQIQKAEQDINTLMAQKKQASPDKQAGINQQISDKQSLIEKLQKTASLKAKGQGITNPRDAKAMQGIDDKLRVKKNVTQLGFYFMGHTDNQPAAVQMKTDDVQYREELFGRLISPEGFGANEGNIANSRTVTTFQRTLWNAKRAFFTGAATL